MDIGNCEVADLMCTRLVSFTARLCVGDKSRDHGINNPRKKQFLMKE